MKPIYIMTLFILSFPFLGGCGTGGGGLGLFERKPEATPANLKVTQLEDADGSKKTTVEATNDANAKKGMNATIDESGGVAIGTGGSEKLDLKKRGFDILPKFGGLLIFIGIVIVGAKVWIPISPVSFGVQCIALGIVNIFITDEILANLTGVIFIIFQVYVLASGGITAAIDNTRQAFKNKGGVS